MLIEAQFDQSTYTLTYIVADPKTKQCIVIDPVLNYEPQSSLVSRTSVDEINKFIATNDLELKYILETHAHADHLSGSQILKNSHPESIVAIGESIITVQKTFKPIFNLEQMPTDGSQFDLLLTDKESIFIGNIEIKTIPTPGHTPACSSFLINNDHLFTGDALFMPDFGTGRCDFPDGSAEDMYNSVHEKLYKLPDNTKVFVGHDYQPGGRELKYCTTIGDSKKSNIHLKEVTSKDEYVNFRTTRDSDLKEPKLLLQSVQVNINAGSFPKKESNGNSYLKIPLNDK